MRKPKPLIARRLLAWYDLKRRDLPWRARPGVAPDPYRVWLSEVMLQQTTARAAAPYFRAFLRRWPSVAALAKAKIEAVLHAWQGLGYYARARNLLRTARLIVAEFGGRFPPAEADLLKLPGVGPYTAAAIAAIAFGARTAAVDANGERVLARLFAIKTPLPKARPKLRTIGLALAPLLRAGDFWQAVMDLGASICKASPRCELCPLRDLCQAHRLGLTAGLPRRVPKRAKPLLSGIAFWVVARDGRVLLRQRPIKGLLGGMIEIPSTPWRRKPWSEAEALREAPVRAPGRWRVLPGTVRHSFTHFELDLRMLAMRGDADAPGLWRQPEAMDDLALPTLTKKLCRHALAATGARGIASRSNP
jgi:A/G-specific adenine glycosylase